MTAVKYGNQVSLDVKESIGNVRKIRAIGSVGKAVSLAVEKFMTIGELIAENHPEIKSDMYNSCKDARDAAKSIERLCEIRAGNEMDYPDFVEPTCDQEAFALVARYLLSSITRVLLLVDVVVVKQLLTAKNRINRSLAKLESIVNFTEFVRAFSVFGEEMVELAYLTGSQESTIKEEKHRAQMLSARQILEHSISILLTSSKTSIVHFDCVIAKENRDTVFCQIRRAMDLIHFVVKESIFDSALLLRNDKSTKYSNCESGMVCSILKQFTNLMEDFRLKTKCIDKSISMENSDCLKLLGSNFNEQWIVEKNEQRIYLDSEIEGGRSISHSNNYLQENVTFPMRPNEESLPLYGLEMREQLLAAFEKLLEKIYDFTDSAYTSHENRENILLLCYRCKIKLNKCLNNFMRSEQPSAKLLDEEINVVLSAVNNLSDQLILSVSDQLIDIYRSVETSIHLLQNLRTCAIQQDVNRMHEHADRFHDYCDHIIDFCKLLRHIAYTETLQVQAKCLAINLRIYGPQMITAVKILSKYPLSKPANENFDAFVEAWRWLTSDLACLAKQNLELIQERTRLNETIVKRVSEPSKNDVKKTVCFPTEDEQEKKSYSESELKEETKEINGYNEKLNDELNDNNDILKRAKNMSAMAFSMYQFTKGSGVLRTTQDLFTQAEYFAEEANRLYKVLRQFSYQVPASPIKKDLLNILDSVPTFVQALQFTVKDHTVGKAATFVKVDHVIRGTKNLMSVINNVVIKCFECANKFKLDFSDLSGNIASGTLRGDNSGSGSMGDSKTTTNSTEGSM